MVRFFLLLFFSLGSFYSQSILPVNLFNLEGSFMLEGVENARFNWRWKTRGQAEKFRVLTIEGKFDNAEYNSNLGVGVITPYDFWGKNTDFYNEIRHTQFNWRIFKMDNGDGCNAVTIENLQKADVLPLTFDFGSIFPNRLVWAESLDQPSYLFNWRWFDRVEENAGKFRLVTLE